MPTPASLLLIDPSGRRRRIELDPLPFKIGRQPENHLILRDNRISRQHAQILFEGERWLLRDSGSLHGTFVNGERVRRRELRHSDRIEFGSQDSYQVLFLLNGADLTRLVDQVTSAPGAGASLPKLRAILEVARALQTGFSVNDVLSAVVDAALAITGADRGFLLLKGAEELEMRVARSREGLPLAESDLRVPRRMIRRALESRRDLLSMTFHPSEAEGLKPEQSIAELDLRSVVCVPLVRIRPGMAEGTQAVDTGRETVGVLYMDSRVIAADLTGGNRELLQTLAIEASTVLENARLLEEERAKQHLEEELELARQIQQSLLPRRLPGQGWFRACGSSQPSRQVGGDYFDVIQVNEHCWSAVVADVSGKGASSALLAALLQGAFLATIGEAAPLEDRLRRINRFLHERTAGEKYATIFHAAIERTGRLRYINAGHCPPMLARGGGGIETLESTSLPAGLLETVAFCTDERQLGAGDKIVIFSDGVTEAQSPRGAFFGRKRLRELVEAHAGVPCAELHDRIQAAVLAFTEGAAQADDVTLLVLEYGG